MRDEREREDEDDEDEEEEEEEKEEGASYPPSNPELILPTICIFSCQSGPTSVSHVAASTSLPTSPLMSNACFHSNNSQVKVTGPKCRNTAAS